MPEIRENNDVVTHVPTTGIESMMALAIRRPVPDSGFVSEATAAITISSHAGRMPPRARTPIRTSAHSATM